MTDKGPIQPATQPAPASSAAPPPKRQGIASALAAVTSNAPHGNTQAVVLQVPKTPIPVQVNDPGFDWLDFGASAAVAIVSALLSYVAIRWQVKKQHGEAVEIGQGPLSPYGPRQRAPGEVRLTPHHTGQHHRPMA